MSNIYNSNIYLSSFSNVCPFPVNNVSLGKKREEELNICDKWPKFIEFRLLNVELRSQLFKRPSVKLHNCLTVSLIWWNCQQLSQTKCGNSCHNCKFNSSYYNVTQVATCSQYLCILFPAFQSLEKRVLFVKIITMPKIDIIQFVKVCKNNIT